MLCLLPQLQSDQGAEVRAGARAPPQAGPGARGLSQVTPALPPALGGRLEKTQAGRILASAPPAVGPGARKENVPSPVALLLCCPLASRGFRSVGCHSSADGRRPVSLCLCSPRGQAESPPARVGGLSGCPLRQGPGDGKAARRTLEQLSCVGSWGPDQSLQNVFHFIWSRGAGFREAKGAIPVWGS